MSPGASTIAHVNEIDDHSEEAKEKVHRLLIAISQKRRSLSKRWNRLVE